MTSARDYLEQFANLDPGRAARSGVPEVVLAEHKTSEQTITIVRRILDHVGARPDQSRAAGDADGAPGGVCRHG